MTGSFHRNHVYRCITYQKLLLGFPIRDVVARVWRSFRPGHLDRGYIRLPRAVGRSRVQYANVHDAVNALPYNGFHIFLAKGLVGYAVRHLLHPAPMLRW